MKMAKGSLHGRGGLLRLAITVIFLTYGTKVCAIII
jgi:hypothetical protein